MPPIIDRVYEGNDTRSLARPLGFEPVVPPLQTRREPRVYDTDPYQPRTEIERRFGRSARFRRFFTCCDKTDPMFRGLETVAFVAGQLR